MTGRSMFRRLGVAVTAVAVGTTLTACEWGGLNSIPMPGTAGRGEGAYRVQIEMPNVTTLTQNSPVRVDDVTVGSISGIELDGWHALVTVSLDEGVIVPANSLARIGQTSLLGSQHLELIPPVGEPPEGRLEDGDVIPLERAGAYLAERSDQVNALIVDANALFGELSLRRDAITELIANISSVSRQLTGLVQDNQAQMAPTLEKLNLVTANLQANKENIAGALDGLGPYISALGESVASGPFFNAYVSNILPAPWWKAVVDSQVAPDLLPEDLQDVIPDEPPTIKRDGE